MKKILAFGASTSKNSINKKFASYVAHLVSNESEIIDLNDYTVELYSVDVEQEKGIPANIKAFNEKIKSVDGLVISMAEHNGSYSAAFKNIFDWSSRENPKIFEGKKILLLSTSPGGRGGVSSLEAAAHRFPFHGAEIVDQFPLPFFNKNFDEKGLKDDELKKNLIEKVNKFKTLMS